MRVKVVVGANEIYELASSTLVPAIAGLPPPPETVITSYASSSPARPFRLAPARFYNTSTVGSAITTDFSVWNTELIAPIVNI
jgi:hypothetical protein